MLFDIICILSVFCVPTYWISFYLKFSRKWEKDVEHLHPTLRLKSILQIEKIQTIIKSENKISQIVFCLSLVTLIGCLISITLFNFVNVPLILIKFLLFLNGVTFIHHLGSITHLKLVKMQIR